MHEDRVRFSWGPFFSSTRSGLALYATALSFVPTWGFIQASHTADTALAHVLTPRKGLPRAMSEAIPPVGIAWSLKPDESEPPPDFLANFGQDSASVTLSFMVCWQGNGFRPVLGGDPLVSG